MVRAAAVYAECSKHDAGGDGPGGDGALRGVGTNNIALWFGLRERRRCAAAFAACGTETPLMRKFPRAPDGEVGVFRLFIAARARHAGDAR